MENRALLYVKMKKCGNSIWGMKISHIFWVEKSALGLYGEDVSPHCAHAMKNDRTKICERQYGICVKLQDTEWSNAGNPQDGAKLISIGLKCVMSCYQLVCSTQHFTVVFKFEVHCHYSPFNSAMTKVRPQNDL